MIQLLTGKDEEGESRYVQISFDMYASAAHGQAS